MDKLKFIIKDDYAVMHRCYGLESDVVIPEECDGKPVLYIDEWAFRSDCEGIESLVLPKSLESFTSVYSLYLTGLKKITFLNENTELDDKSLVGLSNLEEVNFFAWMYIDLPQLVNVVSKTVRDWDTFDCNKQDEILSYIKNTKEIKNSLFLGDNAGIISFLFENEINVELKYLKVYLNHSILNNLTDVTAILLDYQNKNFTQENITAYDDYKELVDIGFKLPTLEEFYDKWDCFDVGDGLLVSKYIGDNEIETIPDVLECGTKIWGFLAPKDHSEKGFYELFEGIKKLKIDAEMDLIPENFFMNSSELEHVILPDTITSIGQKAFANCDNLHTINIPEKVTVIDILTFGFCYNLKNIQLPKKLIDIHPLAFTDCQSLTSITIPDSITHIPDSGFKNCFSLEEVIFSKNVTCIGERAFDGCTSLKSIKNTENITEIKGGAFLKCTNLATDGYIIINNILCQCFINNAKIIVPPEVEFVQTWAFHRNINIEVVFGDTVETVNNRAFAYCENIIKLEFAPTTDVALILFDTCANVNMDY